MIFMRIVPAGRLKACCAQPAHRDAAQPLRAWVKVVRAAEWRNPPAARRMFNSADILRDGRVVFRHRGAHPAHRLGVADAADRRLGAGRIVLDADEVPVQPLCGRRANWPGG